MTADRSAPDRPAIDRPAIDAPTPPPSDGSGTSTAVRILQGMAMGTADIIPGVSGGTVALILGFYTTLVGAIRSVTTMAAAMVTGRRRAAMAQARAVPWGFLLALAAGIAVALGVGSLVLPPLLDRFPVQTSALFFGLIVASLSVPWRHTDAGFVRVGLAAVCGLLAFVVMGLPEVVLVGEPPAWRIVASAAVAISAMILPGVSGAFLLLALGMYEPTLNALRTLDLGYVALFAVGAFIGLGLFSRLLSHLLHRQLSLTMAALTGLMIGALRVLWPWGGSEGRLDAPPAGGEAILALLLALVGFGIVRLLLVLGRRADRQQP